MVELTAASEIDRTRARDCGLTWAYLVPKSPAAVILSPLVTAENPASVNPQSAMIARWPGLFIHQVTAVAGVPAEPVPQKTTSPSWAYDV